MTAIRPTSRHPSAGELVRRLDGELDARTESRLARHLERCDACRLRLDELAAHSDDAGRWLRALAVDEPGDPRRREAARAAIRIAAARRRSVARVRRGWAAAAAVAALLIVSVSVDPLRAWVLQRLTIARPSSAPEVSLPSAVVGRDGSVISFRAGGGTFELSVERAQAAGELLLRTQALDQATAQVMNGTTETMLVLPAGLRIENPVGSQASYRVTLPASVQQVTVRIGDGPPRTIAVPRLGWSERIPLR